ncbi:MAG: hypothetical protein EOP87_01440 [Verrucomicrobiaceae bacterium]|nr:MAG: hypothetical protein EOP87_01440 [Verrucomicrobiaceae bacterium]
MAIPVSTSLFDGVLASSGRTALPTSLGTQELREQMGAEVMARSVFTARGTNAIFVSGMKDVIDQVAAGEMDEASARLALLDLLRATGYTPEGGFPDAPAGSVPPAVAGSIEDLSSFRRLDLIVKTQLAKMAGAGQQARGSDPDRLAQFPAWELIRLDPKSAPRNWSGNAPTEKDPRPRWVTAGGTLKHGGRMIALKGDPIWGELGSFENFPDGLGVDHPPFAFGSGMGWQEVSRAECDALGITGPDGETPDEFLAKQPRTMAGKMPLPSPQLSMKDVDPELVKSFQESTHATVRVDSNGVMDFSALLTKSVAAHDAAYAGGGQ